MKKFFLIALVAIAFAGCGKDEEPNCDYNECGTKAPDSEIQSVQAYLTANGIVATQHCSGLFYAIDQDGTGAKPNICNAVSVYYEGKLTNGTVFDKGVQRPNTPASFRMGGVVTGFTNGLMQMKIGGKIRLYIPPSLGYGSQQYLTIPGNSILIFTVELLGVQ